jgi:NADP-dependent 3-hydroxy acid dehydrogenase YdfG
MTQNLSGTAALVTGASSGIGAATALRLAEDGASVALVARRKNRLEDLAAQIQRVGGTALVVEADLTDRLQAESAVEQAVERFGRLDVLVNNAGLMLLGPVVGADPDEWDRMIAINNQGLLYTTHAALPHLLQAAENGPRNVADIVNISSIAGRVAWNGYGVYNMTKFGVNGFTEALRQEVTKRHVRVGSSNLAGGRPNWARTTAARSATRSSPSTRRPRCCLPRTSPTASPTWSPDHATPPSASSGSRPPTKSDRIRSPRLQPGRAGATPTEIDCRASAVKIVVMFRPAQRRAGLMHDDLRTTAWASEPGSVTSRSRGLDVPVIEEHSTYRPCKNV